MKSTYKRLGDLITPFSEKNSELVTSDLRGVNYQKYFMPSVANTHGVDLSNYKVIRNNQFACNLMHVGRDECLPIALHKGDKPIIVSPAYFSFHVNDESEILSDYLFIWFKRPEFDREACFYTDADVRQGLVKSAFLDMNIAVPPIEEQRKIVAEYQAIERRIESNRRLIATLEATAQTIYRKMFVDNIDPEDLPKGWRMGKMKDVATFAYGKMPKDKDNGVIPVFSGYGVVGYCNEAMYDKQHIVVIARGDSGSGKIVKSPKEFYLTNLAIAIKLNNESYRDYLYYHLLSLDTLTLRTGSAQAQVTINSIKEFDILIPTVDICAGFYSVVDRIGAVKLELAQEEDILNNFSSLLLTKLSKL